MASVFYLKRVLDEFVLAGTEIANFCTGRTVDVNGDFVPTGEIAESTFTINSFSDFGDAMRDGATQAAFATNVVPLLSPMATYDWGTLTHIVFRDGAGRVIDVVPLAEPITVLTGQRARIAVGAATYRAS